MPKRYSDSGQKLPISERPRVIAFFVFLFELLRKSYDVHLAGSTVSDLPIRVKGNLANAFKFAHVLNGNVHVNIEL